MYSALSRAFVPMSETIDGGEVEHENPSAHDGVSEMHGVYSKEG